MIHPHVPSHLAHLPRVSGLTLHRFPHATLTLEDGTTRQLDSNSRASLVQNCGQGWAVVVMAWDNPQSEVFAIPPKALPEVLRGFPEYCGVVTHVERHEDRYTVLTEHGGVHQYAFPLSYTVVTKNGTNPRDQFHLTDKQGWPIAIFDLPTPNDVRRLLHLDQPQFSTLAAI
ncbi:hypothetical protein ACFP81_10705 [Deinococcus lacus]|uniref:DUF1854 domain-containing protein n=1 Tax=Deinococcus lacus TaxID=392561 RepID=A0ABW1YG56_9DEIO